MEEVSCGRSDATGLCGFCKNVKEAKEGPLKFRRKKARIYELGVRRGEKAQVCLRKREKEGGRGRKRKRVSASDLLMPAGEEPVWM